MRYAVKNYDKGTITLLRFVSFRERYGYMKRNTIIIAVLSIILIGGISIVSVNYKSISATVSNKFWQFLAEQFDKEEKAREESKYGGIGKDTIISLGDGKFSIGKFADDKVLVMYNEDKTMESLLCKVSKYKTKKGKLYIISDEGYGIADSKTNTCKLFVSVSPEQFTNGYGIDSDGIHHPISRFLNDEHVEYLQSYDEFSSEEKVIFEKM
jgi:hypothetical protein